MMMSFTFAFSSEHILYEYDCNKKHKCIYNKSTFSTRINIFHNV